MGQVMPARQMAWSPPGPVNPGTGFDASSNRLPLPPDTMRARTCPVWNTTAGPHPRARLEESW